ncbi:MAG: 30S ribosomal protein S6 [Alphaproteobacteria bacterium CG11_big_fil_rev_8_21_14_0_20_44_7]|nr:MAG: 30S ribosomal protein S6 [Alphaproteobacteria bacterium CG11_big_fil_rev_8_21_14_0_20_44_7]
MALYEITYIVRQEIGEKEVETITKEFTEFLTKNGGKIIKNESWGLRNFAYEIRKAKKGHYVHLGVDADHAEVAELERNMKLHENVIRCLIVRAEEINDEPSAILNQDEDEYQNIKIEA